MGVHFNADEIFEIAERIEKNGARFYRKAAENTNDEKARKMLLELADMEDDHEKTFSEMRKDLQSSDRTPSRFDPDNETAAYLQAFADGHIFDVNSDPCEMLTGSESIVEVLKMAIGMEKDSVVFYLEMKEMVPPGAGQEKIQHIIGEERKHIGVLAREVSHAKRAE